MSKVWTSAIRKGLLTAVIFAGVWLPADAFASSASDEPSILSHMEAREPVFTLRVGTSSAAALQQEVKDALARDPYLMLDVASYRFVLTSSPLWGNRAVFAVRYRETKAQYAAVLQGVRKILQEILKPGMDVYAKEKGIHDFVVLHTSYDTTLRRDSAYDALYARSATCEGYTMLTYQLLRGAGIPNVIVVGTATSPSGSGSHAWNEVELNGTWYHLDTTWDDPVPDVPGRVTYGYFNLTSAQLARTHTWDRSQVPPADTDIVQVLARSANQEDQRILQETGLFVEQPAYTFTRLNSLTAALSGLRPGQTTMFRVPYVDAALWLSALRLPYAVRCSCVQDTRDPGYAVVTLTVT
ncbi:hypothetical protein GCM10010885_22480 [Alicyclobacillus cellulosilyticus]|uniref:Transglutaminase-like domain-containing protein n=1 Tax=Alicyclobacillus cellulosilyticus TaxID=1003997 RepID=A0A917KHG8_9BACL|nr:transglutaminase domain-containing protein [Alicyclobacillus cellulosilyticus]GGJ12599.1 hypothetical protein GCM10010885_22480 [Alicyclobacillus cellulosilyticus]